MQKWLYVAFVKNRIIKFIGSPFVIIVIPPILALYYSVLDIWGEDWDIIKNYRTWHERVFIILGGATVIVLVLKGIAEQFRRTIAEQYFVILQSMMSFFNELVKKKKDRFYNKALDLRPNADIFSIITHPDDQIEYALDGAKRFLINAFRVEQKNIAITIIQGVQAEDAWRYAFKCDSQRQHTKPQYIMESKSTAKYCYETGDSLFISDIRKGEKEGVFLPTERSRNSKIGSIYCKPVRVDVGSISYTYIFTIVVYNQFICTPYDEEECRACERVLDEISDRVELELYLYSIKNFKQNGGNNT